MTKKDYELIAGVLRYTAPDFLQSIEAQETQWTWIVHSFAETLEKNNPKFDEKKFLTACGIEN